MHWTVHDTRFSINTLNLACAVYVTICFLENSICIVTVVIGLANACFCGESSKGAWAWPGFSESRLVYACHKHGGSPVINYRILTRPDARTEAYILLMSACQHEISEIHRVPAIETGFFSDKIITNVDNFLIKGTCVVCKVFPALIGCSSCRSGAILRNHT